MIWAAVGIGMGIWGCFFEPRTPMMGAMNLVLGGMHLQLTIMEWRDRRDALEEEQP